MLAAVALFVTGFFFTFVVRKLPKFSALCWFIAFSGATGWVLDLFQTGTGWLTSIAGFVIAPVALLLGLSLYLILRVGHDLYPKNKGAANRQTVIAAGLLPMILTVFSWPIGDLILRLGHGLLAAGNRLGGVI